MNLTSLNAISPVDGRYRKATKDLSGYFSEAGLINRDEQLDGVAERGRGSEF